MVHHVFSRCKPGGESRATVDSVTRHSTAGMESVPSSNRASFAMPTPETVSFPLSNMHTQGDEADVPISESALPLPLPTDGAGASHEPDLALAEQDANGPNQNGPQSRITLYVPLT